MTHTIYFGYKKFIC